MEITEDSLFECLEDNERKDSPRDASGIVGSVKDWRSWMHNLAESYGESESYHELIDDAYPDYIVEMLGNDFGLDLSKPGEVENIVNTFDEIAMTIKNKNVMMIQSPVIGEVEFPYGFWGNLNKINTGGFGIEHIIQGRYEKDNLHIKDISILLYLIYDIINTKENYTLQNSSSFDRLVFERDDIAVVVSKNWYNTEKNWIITGFGKYDEYGKLTRVATDAIRSFNPHYSYALEHSFICEQVGAVINSINIIRENQKNNQQKEKLITQCLNNKNKSAIDRAKSASQISTRKNKNINKDER